MRDSHRVIRNINHVGVFDLIDGVTTNVGYLASLGDQDDVVAFQETDKAWGKRVEEYLTKKLERVQEDILHSTAYMS